MVITCDIVFDQNSHGTYFAGQTVSGNIVLNTDKIKTIKNLSLHLVGCARTKWTENRDTSANTKSSSNELIIYHGREDYVASKTYLLGSEECEYVQIQPGTHNFNFSGVLPPQCPSSFEGKFGHIRYVVKVVLNRPWKFDQTFSRGFTVLKLVDLNLNSPMLKTTAVQEAFKTFCCGPCTSQPLKLNVSIPQTGFVPGEAITTLITVTNESKVSVIDLQVTLVMLVTLFSQHPKMNSHLERIDLVKIKAGAVNSRTTRTITQLIRIPATPPTCYNSCRLVKISYELEVIAKLKRIHQSPIVTIPITIGNVPIVDTVTHQPLPDSSKFQLRTGATETLDEPTISTISSINLTSTIDLTDLQIPPPSYEEAVFMTRADCNEDDKNAVSKSEFVPRYPVYCCAQASETFENEQFQNNDPDKSTWL